MSEPLLQVKDLKIYYPVRAKNALGGSVSYLHAVDDVSFDVYKGETFGTLVSPVAANPPPAVAS